MSRATQIEWWLEQVEATRRAVSVAREERSRPRHSSLVGERSRVARVAPLPTMAPAAHVVLRGATITDGRDEERARSLPASSSGGGAAASSTASRSGSVPGTADVSMGAGGHGAVGRARQLAAGYQPAVIKVVSYARGAARATATGQYVQREEVALETHDGRMLGDREAVAEEIKAWSASFSKRAESQDVAAIRLKLHGVRDTPDGRETYEKAIAAGFTGHRYAYRIDALSSGELEARLVVALAGSQRERFRVREERIGDDRDGFRQRRLDLKSEAVLKARIQSAIGRPTHAVSIDPGAAGHGRDGVTYRLNKLVEKGAAIDDRGKAIANIADARVAAREWGRSLRSQSSRDTMHLIISAKAGTDVAALTEAARAFLHDRFADHKFMFGIHTDKEAEGHIHAHAVITVKNEAGQKIHPGRETFSDWREAYAQHAQAQGLKIVATSARERASSQSYGPKDKAIVDAAERPRPAREARDRAYAADPANWGLIDKARERIRAARTNPIRLPTSEPDRRTARESVEAWSSVVREGPGNTIAKDMLERLTMAQTIGEILHTIAKRVDHLTKEEQDMPITSEQMAKDLRSMNDAVSRTTDLLDGETRQQFRETSARYLETLANRIDLQQAQERGVEQLSRADIENIAGANADVLIERAEALRLTEEREAASARLLADRAVEAERRDEAQVRVDPGPQSELRADRATAAVARQSAAREEREAAAATSPESMLSQPPPQPFPQVVLQADALVKLRLEQENIIRELEAEGADGQSIKGQRIG